MERAWNKRAKLREIKKDLCLPKPEYRHGPRQVKEPWRKHHLEQLDFRIKRARGYSTNCGVGSAWFRSIMHCIAIRESGNSNSWAGYFGFIYPPSSYVHPGPAVARKYGNSWLNIPYDVQLTVAWGLYTHYGFSPWTTAPACT